MITLEQKSFETLDDLKEHLSSLLGDNKSIITENKLSYCDDNTRDSYEFWRGSCVIDGNEYPVYPSTINLTQWIRTHRCYNPDCGNIETKDFYESLPTIHPDYIRIQEIGVKMVYR